MPENRPIDTPIDTLHYAENPEVVEVTPSARAGAVLGDRYGARSGTGVSQRVKNWLIAGTLTLAIAGIAWATMGPGTVTIRGKDVGFKVVSSEEVEITFDVAKPQKSTVSCTLNALNQSFAQVGTKNITVGPSDVTESRYTTTIATTELAVTAVIAGCELVH